jgi:pimeloyl-ACP methyl ester carboxylesterase
MQINTMVIGNGEPLVMVHGWGANIELLQPLADTLASHGYKIYMLDLPGFGTSDEPPRAYTVFDYAQFCIAYLDYFKLDRVNLFGHSFGGRLGLILASDYAERINKMVLSDSAGIKTKANLAKQLRLKSYQFIRNSLYTIGATSLADALREAYNQRYASTDFKQVSGVMRETFVKVINQDLLDHAARVAVPTILIWGDKDEATPLWQGKKLEATIPDSALIVHEGAGHYAYLEFPQKTANIMHALFKG